MLPAAEAIPVAQLRALVSRRVRTDGLRPVARAIGLHPSSVISFVDGAEPRESTRQKLTAWYVREIAAAKDIPDPNTVRAAIDILLYSIPPARLDSAVRELANKIAEIHAGQGRDCPAWLRPFVQRGMEE